MAGTLLSAIRHSSVLPRRKLIPGEGYATSQVRASDCGSRNPILTASNVAYDNISSEPHNFLFSVSVFSRLRLRLRTVCGRLGHGPIGPIPLQDCALLQWDVFGGCRPNSARKIQCLASHITVTLLWPPSRYEKKKSRPLCSPGKCSITFSRSPDSGLLVENGGSFVVPVMLN